MSTAGNLAVIGSCCSVEARLAGSEGLGDNADVTFPSGWVTFMFTDIEGSTRLHQRLGADFATLIREHDALLAGLIDRRGGVVIKSLGDGMFAAFGDAGAAVGTAAEIQRALRARDWPGGVELRVRAGLHRGEVTPTAGDYVSLSVHQAARVCDAAFGGQVLATLEVVDAIQTPPIGRWVQAGAYRLKDFDDPVALSMLSVPGAEFGIASARATPAAAHNVPEVPTSFVGRDAELAHLTAMLRDGTRLVSLLGPGGVGKTRLAFETVRRSAQTYADGAWVVLLANATASALDSRVLRAIRLPERPDTPPRRTITTALQFRHTLLVLDNTEHVTDEAAALVRELLDECPRLAVLMTSREPLGLADEVPLRLEPLPVSGAPGTTSASVELFIQRASARDRQSTFDDEARRQIEDICRQVDGLPLGIELAAGRLRHMTLLDLASRLETRLNSAPVNRRDLDDRQRTLNALVDWSYQLLGVDAQRMLRRMSVFEGPAPLEALEALADPCDDVAELLADLVDKSLIAFEPDADRPYRMLVTIRGFARRRLDEGDEAAEVRRRHVAYQLHLARNIWSGFFGPEAERWVLLADDRYDDFAAALAFAWTSGDADTLAELAYILARCLYDHGRVADGDLWLFRAAESPCSASLRTKVLAFAGFRLAHQGDIEKGLRWCEQALELALDSGDRDLVVDARLRLAQVIVTFLPDHRSRAATELDAALALDPTPLQRGLMQNTRGVVHYFGDDMDEAIAAFRAACDAYRSVGYIVGLPNALANLAESLLEVGRLDEAEEALHEALRTAGTQRTSRTQIQLYFAVLCVRRGDSAAAADWAAKALDLARQDGNAWAMQQINNFLAETSGHASEPGPSTDEPPARLG